MKSINAVFCLLLFAWLFGCTDRSSPTYIATKSAEAWCGGDVDEYLECMYITDDEEGEELDAIYRKKIGKEVEEYEANGGVVDIEAVEEEISEDGKYGGVGFDITFRNGEKMEGATILLENIDGEWYVYNPVRDRDDE